jgi:hypothetical protein
MYELNHETSIFDNILYEADSNDNPQQLLQSVLSLFWELVQQQTLSTD